jgi:hypothetical protein
MSKPVLLSLNDAAESILGWKGRFRGKKLLRKVLAKEKRTGRELASRARARNGKVGYLVTSAMIRAEFPELLIPSAEGIALEVRAKLDAINTQIERMVEESVAKHMDSCLSQSSRQRVELNSIKNETRVSIDEIFDRIGTIEKMLGRLTGHLSS